MRFIKMTEKRILLFIKNALTGSRRYEIDRYTAADIRKECTYYLVRPVYGIQLGEEFCSYGYSIFSLKNHLYEKLDDFEYCIKKTGKEACRFKIPELSEIRVLKILDSKVAVVTYCESFIWKTFYVPVAALYGACFYTGKPAAQLNVYGPNGVITWDSCITKLSCTFYKDSIRECRNIIYVSIISLFLYTKDGCAASFFYGVKDALDNFYNTVFDLESKAAQGSITEICKDKCIREITNSLAEFMKDLLKTIADIDGFQMYDGPDIFELFKFHTEKEYQEEQEKKNAEADAEHKADVFIKQLESRRSLLKQFNNI